MKKDSIDGSIMVRDESSVPMFEERTTLKIYRKKTPFLQSFDI